MDIVNGLHIDPEFRALIPPLSSDERVQLEANIVRDGCRDPLVVWNDLLLDGHNRYEICQSYGLHFETVTVALEDRDAAADWIDTNQFGRRNLTPDQASLLRGRRYNRSKQTGFRQNDGNAQTAERLAVQHGVSSRTIERDGSFADAVEALKPHVPDIEQRVMAGDVPSKQAVVEAAKELERAREILRQHAPRHTTPQIGPPQNGLHFARLALMRLEEIRENDIERTAAFLTVRSWLDARKT